MMEGGQILRFYDNPEGERYVSLVDVVCWCHEFAQYLMAEGQEERAEGVAAVGNAMADQLGPDPEPERRTTCQKCGGPYDEDVDAWGVCAECLTDVL